MCVCEKNLVQTGPYGLKLLAIKSIVKTSVHSINVLSINIMQREQFWYGSVVRTDLHQKFSVYAKVITIFL